MSVTYDKSVKSTADSMLSVNNYKKLKDESIDLSDIFNKCSILPLQDSDVNSVIDSNTKVNSG